MVVYRLRSFRNSDHGPQSARLGPSRYVQYAVASWLNIWQTALRMGKWKGLREGPGPVWSAGFSPYGLGLNQIAYALKRALQTAG